jgi:hypothetical protein
MSLKIEDIAIPPHLDVTSIATPTTPPKISKPSLVTATSEVKILCAEIKRYQEEMHQYINKMDLFQTLPETIVLQVGNLAPPSVKSTSSKPESQEGRHRICK